MIGGIPYNRVHELEFQPGEVRLDVTYDSVRAYLQQQEQDEVKREQYQAMLQQGRLEWDRLSLMETEAIVSKKDQMIENERVQIEERYKKQQEMRAAEESANRKRREQRMQELQRERQREAPMNDQDNDSGSLVSAGILGTGVATMAMVSAFSSDGRDGEVKVGLSDESGWEDEGRSIQSPHTKPTLATNVAADTAEVGAAVGDSQAIAQAASSKVPTSDLSQPQKFEEIPTYEERVKKAEEAMAEYMDLDDGGDDWLKMMADIAMEDDSNQDKHEVRPDLINPDKQDLQ